MGYAKYHEDDYHILCERLYSNSISDINISRQQKPLHKCPYCDELFELTDGLFSHIRHRHNITEPLLFVNGRGKKQCMSLK